MRITLYPRAVRIAWSGLFCGLLAGCDAPQSLFATAGREAEDVLGLLIALMVMAAIVWVSVIAFAVYAGRSGAWRPSNRTGNFLVLGGGVVLPILVLGGFLIYALPMTSTLRAPGDGPTIQISGERFWWRITYTLDGQKVETANELKLPVGQRSNLELTSPDVIHSFWVPALAGKLDVIPGRTTRMTVEPTRTGRFRGQCAEFCGASHAFMGIAAVTLPPEEFDAWLRREAEDAPPPTTQAEQRGQETFLAQGCGACHTVRGTPAAGQVGPDLTHFAARGSAAAETLPNEPDALRRWLAHAREIKPEITMPRYDMLDEETLSDLVAYLGSLQ